MGLKCGLVLVHLVKVDAAWIGVVLQHIEAEASRLIPHGSKGIIQDCLNESISVPWLDLNGNED